MANIAGIRNFQSVGGCRSDETKGVTAHVHVGYRLLDLRHMAGNALIALAACFVVCVLLYGRRVGAVRRVRAVTIEA